MTNVAVELVHHGTALVELEKITEFGRGRTLAQIRTPVGRTVARWCGDQNARPGSYDVEWTVDQIVVWGRNAGPAAAAEAGVRLGGRGVILRVAQASGRTAGRPGHR